MRLLAWGTYSSLLLSIVMICDGWCPSAVVTRRSQMRGSASPPLIVEVSLSSASAAMQTERPNCRVPGQAGCDVEPILPDRVLSSARISSWPSAGDGSPAGGWRVVCNAAMMSPELVGQIVGQNPKTHNRESRNREVCYGIWSRRADSNRGPADYESAALPTELRRPGVPAVARGKA
jgi:hypothetical protein